MDSSSPELKRTNSSGGQKPVSPFKEGNQERSLSETSLGLSLTSSFPSSSTTSADSLATNSENSLVGSVESCADSELFPPSTYPVLAESAFSWSIQCWSQLSSRVIGHKFIIGHYTFSLMMQKEGHMLSLFLALHSVDRPTCVDLVFEATSPDGMQYHQRGTSHRFSMQDFIDASSAPDWGFKNFVSLAAFESKLVQSDAVRLNVHIRILKDSSSFQYSHHMSGWNASTIDDSYPLTLATTTSEEDIDERGKLGFLGLVNQGATCYMNSILQSLYLTNSFRKSLLQVPTRGHDPHDSIALALQRLFWQLQFGKCSPNTNELTDSFGWDTMQAFTQHDVQEFLRALLDGLEEKMKGTPVEGSIEKLFVAKVGQIVKCLHVNFESIREDTLYDVQLPIYGCKNLQESLEHFIAPEFLEGNNKYNAEGHGLQDAKMYSMFTKLPPVLHLILMRYRYDPETDQTVKINDRFEFPDMLDMRPYVKDPADGEDYVYELHSVLVHSGDLHGGHYCAFIKEFEKEEWFKFDDNIVSKATKMEAVDDNYGEDPQPAPEAPSDLSQDAGLTRPRIRTRRNFKRITNAYMLVYVKRLSLQQVLQKVEETDYDGSIGPTILAELESAKRKAKQEREARISMDVNWTTWDKVLLHHGPEVLPSLDQGTGHMSFEKMSVRHNDSRVRAVKAKFVEELGMSAQDLQLVPFVCNRQRTRATGLLHPEEQYFHRFLDSPIEYLLAVPQKAFAVQDPPTKSHVLLVWKLFDGGSLQTLALTLTSDKTVVGDLASRVLAHVGRGDFADGRIAVTEEYTSRKLVPKELALTLSNCKAIAGDIMIIHARSDKARLDAFFAAMYNVVHVQLRSLDDERASLDVVVDRNGTMEDLYKECSTAAALPLGSFRILTAAADSMAPQLNFPLVPDTSKLFEPRSADRYHFYVFYLQPNRAVNESTIMLATDQMTKARFNHDEYVGKPVRALLDVVTPVLLPAHDESVELWVLHESRDQIVNVLSADDPLPAKTGRYVLASRPTVVDGALVRYRLGGRYGVKQVTTGTKCFELLKTLACDKLMVYLMQPDGALKCTLTPEADICELLAAENDRLFFECISNGNTQASSRTFNSSSYASPALKLKK